MHEAGYLPDDDPATLLNALSDPDARHALPVGADRGRSMQAMQEAAQGEAPGATVINRPVSFQELQNLRSSISEAHEAARANGRTREAAALDEMRRAIDERANLVADGRGLSHENFPADMVQQWRDAVAMHADRMQTYRTGPTASIFRQGGDGLPAAQGGELAPQFFSSRPSQADDMAAFMRIQTPETRDLLKNYAITDAASQVKADGSLSNAKLSKWEAARSGALRDLLTNQERATLRGVVQDVARADNAANLGRAVGSNTAQNAQDALRLGLLDNRMVNILANRIPLLGSFTGPLLETVRQGARAGRVERLGGLLSDPAELDRALAAYQAANGPRLIGDGGLLGGGLLGEGLLRAAPVLAVGR